METRLALLSLPPTLTVAAWEVFYVIWRAPHNFNYISGLLFEAIHKFNPHLRSDSYHRRFFASTPLPAPCPQVYDPPRGALQGPVALPAV